MLPNLILTPVSTSLLAIADALTFGVLPLVLSLPWLVCLWLLIGTSWLWAKVPLARPVLLVPGVILSVIGFEYTAFVPEMGEKYQKLVKLGLRESWPYSLRFLHYSQEWVPHGP